MGKLDEKADSLRFASLNVRGINNFRKRRSAFAWCKKQKVGLIFLQETHSTENHESQWMRDWGSQILFSHGSSDARGVAVLFKRGLNIKIKIGDKIYDVIKCRCQTFYSLLIETKTIPSNGFQKVTADFNLEDDDVKEVFMLSKTAATETFINSFQYKILNNIAYTNSRLTIIGYVQSDSCTFCGMCRETRDDLFFLCSFSEKFWNEFANYWLLVSGTHFTPTLLNVIVGKFDLRPVYTTADFGYGTDKNGTCAKKRVQIG